VLIKDNIDTADKMRTTAGSLALADSFPKRDAFLVRKLREAGAVLLGKTNLSEWANFRSTRSTSGWSGRGGFTRNPYATDRNPSGSSSGSAVAVAANFCAVAVGTETDGSIVSPSSANGIVGIKPTLGLISRTGIIPIAHSQDTAGPMARTVADAAVLLGILAGMDPADPATAGQRIKPHPDYPQCLDRNGLRGARIGVARNLMGYHNRVDELVEKAAALMKNQGAVLVDPVEIPNLKTIGDHEFEVLLYEFKHDLDLYLAARGKGESPRSLEDLIEYNKKNAASEMPFFGQEIFLKARDKGPLTDAKYLKALKAARRLARQEGIDAVLGKHRLEAIAAPTDAPPWVTDPVNGDHFLGGCSTLPAVAGYPHITVPMGTVFGLPVGISFFAGAWSEPTLIKIAFAFEQASNARKPPLFLPTAPLE
jgi:amidase